jgi:hypothetical protein
MFARYPASGWFAWGDEANEEIEPRGKVHPGYRGGPVQLPILDSHARMDEMTARAVSYELRRRYDEGRSIRELVTESGYSIARVRSLLQRADTSFRDRGAPSHADTALPELNIE